MEDTSVKSANDKYDTKIPDTFNVMMIYSEDFYSSKQELSMIQNHIRLGLRSDDTRHYYIPPVDLSQLHVTNKHYHIPAQ